jgi:hypothetical protein
MALAVLFTICLQLGGTTRALPRSPGIPAQTRSDVQAFRSEPSILMAQAVPPAGDRSPASSETPSPQPVPPSPAHPTSQPDSHDAQSTSAEKKASPKAKHKKRRHKVTSPTTPRKVVVRNGSAADPSPQFSATISPEQASHEKQDTAVLLAEAGANLQKLLGHQLNSSQQDTSAQVRGYMKQAKSAEDAGDLQSAHNLALKALLLSNELVRK